MNKMPVGQTIAQTYAFAFRNYFSILGAIWLPLLLFGVVGYYVFLPALEAMPAFIRDTAQHAQQHSGVPYLPPSLGTVLRGIFLFEGVALLVMPILAVAVTREALGLRHGPIFVYMAVGKRELLVFGAVLTVIALYVGALVALIIAGGLASVIAALVFAGAQTGHTDPVAAVATTLLVVRIVSLLFYLVVFYFAVRLCFLMVPATTAENRFGVWRSWQLTKRNFWRCVGVTLGTFLPATIVTYALWFVVLGPEIFEYWWNVQVHPELAASNIEMMTQAMTGHLPYIAAYLFIASPINYGLLFGQSAFAYRALVGDGPRG